MDRTQSRTVISVVCPLAIVLLMMSAAPLLAEQEAATQGIIDSITKPLHRFDVHLEFQHPDSGVNAWTTTLRYQRPYEMGAAGS